MRGDEYQFALTLKNRAGIPVEMPAIELTLTDAQEQPVLRRVLPPSELAAPAELAAQEEWSATTAVSHRLWWRPYHGIPGAGFLSLNGPAPK